LFRFYALIAQIKTIKYHLPNHYKKSQDCMIYVAHFQNVPPTLISETICQATINQSIAFVEALRQLEHGI